MQHYECVSEVSVMSMFYRVGATKEVVNDTWFSYSRNDSWELSIFTHKAHVRHGVGPFAWSSSKFSINLASSSF